MKNENKNQNKYHLTPVSVTLKKRWEAICDLKKKERKDER